MYNTFFSIAELQIQEKNKISKKITIFGVKIAFVLLRYYGFTLSSKYEMYEKELTGEEEKLPSDVEDAVLEAEKTILPEKSRMMYEKRNISSLKSGKVSRISIV